MKNVSNEKSVKYRKASPDNGFFGEYRFLTLEYEIKIHYCGLEFTNAMALLQALMSGSTKYYKQFERVSGYKACLIGGLINHDWVTKKLLCQMLYEVNLAKFTQFNYLKQYLLNTGDCNLVNVNYVGDTTLGVYNGEGMNLLGKALEVVRRQLRGDAVDGTPDFPIDQVQPIIYKDSKKITRYSRK